MSKQNNKKKKDDKIILIVSIIVIIAIAIFSIFFIKGQKAKDKEITYDQLYQDIIDKKVEKIEIGRAHV